MKKHPLCLPEATAQQRKRGRRGHDLHERLRVIIQQTERQLKPLKKEDHAHPDF